jgi:hypothetical protein
MLSMTSPMTCLSNASKSLLRASASTSDLACLLAKQERRAGTSRLSADLAAYAAECLTIRSKPARSCHSSSTARSSTSIDAIEGQRRETGKARALILKGRHQGCSTYVGPSRFIVTTG